MIKTLLKWAFGAPMHIDDPDWEDDPLETGGGFPHEYEFRVDPAQECVAIWVPAQRKWMIFVNIVSLREVHPMDTDVILGNWTRYLEVENGE